MLTFGLSALAIVGLLWAVLMFFVWRGQERMVFFPPAEAVAVPSDVERVDFTAPDGQRLLYFLVRPLPADSGATLLLVFHGNADLAAWQIPWAREVVRRTGAVVVLAEYRGYGGLPGTPTYAGTRSDALATWAMLRAREGATPERTVLYGHSLGSAVAAELAAETRPRALVLESPFSSARAMAARMPIPGLTLLWRAVARVRYDTRARVAALEVPVWVAHGAGDAVIPVEMGREVFAAAARKGELLVVDEAEHNDLRIVAGERYWEWLGRAVGRAGTRD
ncbi:MAG TPA: alpha/beta fold hydrolase [Gemmatimonadaceae bacterium]|nr:alpha/beta fold hydrolase [Gemmatimonadaceae bacterium]